MIVDGFARGYPRFFSRVLQSTSPNKKHNPTSEGNDLLYIRVNLTETANVCLATTDLPCNDDNDNKGGLGFSIWPQKSNTVADPSLVSVAEILHRIPGVS